MKKNTWMGGLTRTLQKVKNVTDDLYNKTSILDLMTKDKYQLTGPELKRLFQSGLKGIFRVGDMINVGNGDAICIDTNIRDDYNGNDSYAYTQSSTFANNINQKGYRYSYCFIMIPNTRCNTTKMGDVSKYKDSDIPEIVSLYNNMDSDVRSCIENTVIYNMCLDGNAGDYSMYKNTYYLHGLPNVNHSYRKTYPSVVDYDYGLRILTKAHYINIENLLYKSIQKINDSIGIPSKLATRGNSLNDCNYIVVTTDSGALKVYKTSSGYDDSRSTIATIFFIGKQS